MDFDIQTALAFLHPGSMWTLTDDGFLWHDEGPAPTLDDLRAKWPAVVDALAS